MSYYYKQSFTSATPLYASIKETLRSYFESGAIDDLMFPIWTDDCLDRFSLSTYQIVDGVIEVNGYQAALPDDFKAIREAWFCSDVSRTTQAPVSFYYQKDCRVSTIDDACSALDVPLLGCDPCDKKYRVTHKVTNEVLYTFGLSFLMKPGVINHASQKEPGHYRTGAFGIDSYDITDCKFITAFENGTVYITYYTNTLNEDGERMIPDNIRIKDYIRSYIMYKIFEFLSHQVTDETANQIENKMMYYKQEYSENLVKADIDLKKETVWEKNRKIIETKKRYRNYDIR